MNISKLNEQESKHGAQLPVITSLIAEFLDLTPVELLNHLPPMHEIQHAVDFIPRATLPNMTTYRMSPKQHQELQH